MIELIDLTKRYRRFPAVDRINLKVGKGVLQGFLGPNGAGKTTTVRMMAGVLKQTAGRILIDGMDLEREPTAVKQIVGFIPDRPFLYEKLTGREFLHFVAEMYAMSTPRRDRILESLIRRLDIGEFLDQLTESYSHGMKQKVVLAAALLHDPAVLLIDEPMVGLDPRVIRAVKGLFVEHTRRGGTVFMSTHTLDIAEAVADRIGIIQEGELIAIGTLDQLRAQARREHSLEEIFLELTEADDG